MRGSRAPAPRARRGVGIVLVMVLVVLLAGSVVAVARQAHASRVSGTTQSVVAGALALQAATAALEEALLTVGQRANDPADPLFAHLRQADVPRGQELTIKTPRVLELFRADPLTAGLTLTGGGVKVSLLERHHIGLTATEHDGRVRLVAEVVHAPTGTVRRLTREHTLRVNHLSTPRPFDQLTWGAVAGERLLDPAGNARIAEAIESLTDLRTRRAPKIVQEVREAGDKLNRLLDALAGGQSDKRVDPAQLAQPFEPERFPEPPAIQTGVGAAFHWFAPEEVLFTKVARVEDLASLYLTPRADAAERDAEAAWTAASAAISKYEQALADLLKAVHSTSARKVDVSVALSAYARWLNTLRPLADALARSGTARADQLGLYRSYEDATVELTSGARKYLREQATQLEPEALRARASHRFEGADAAARAVKFLAHYTGKDAEGGLHAVVFVDNRGGPPLNLEALRGADGMVRIRGKLTLAATGAVDLANVVLENRATDLFVVYAGGALVARERIEASLIAGDEFRPTDLVMSGNLILTGSFDPAKLKGKLDRDGGRYFSGAGKDLRGVYTQAALSPWPVQSFVERSAP